MDHRAAGGYQPKVWNSVGEVWGIKMGGRGGMEEWTTEPLEDISPRCEKVCVWGGRDGKVWMDGGALPSRWRISAQGVYKHD